MGGAAPVDSGGKKGKKPLDAELNVVPFIDLLSCCISFLLITAVWTQVSRLQVSQSGGPPQEQQEEQKNVDIKVMVTERGFSLVLPGTTNEIPRIAGNGEQRYDYKMLAEKLKTVKAALPEQRTLTVLPEDGVNYDDLVSTVDTCVGEQFPDVSVSAAVN